MITSGQPLHSSALISAPKCNCSARVPEESDAQSVRTAVLLDELTTPAQQAGPERGPVSAPEPARRQAAAGPHIVVEVKTGNAISLLQYSCSPRVLALPSNQLNARRSGSVRACTGSP